MKLLRITMFACMCIGAVWAGALMAGRRTYQFGPTVTGEAFVAADTLTISHMANGDWGDFSISGNSATLDADVVGTDEMANADHGDFTYSNGSATLDADVVSTDEMANADHGDFTYSNGSATLDDDVVGAAELANGDYGDITFTNGSITIDESVIALADFAFGATEGDMLVYTSEAWAVLDCNEPNDVLTISDSNTPVWQAGVPITAGGAIGPGNSKPGKGKIKFTEDDLIAMLGDVGIAVGTEDVDAGTKVTITEDTSGADLYFEFQADANEDDSDRWRFHVADSGNFYLDHFADGSWLTAQAWTPDSNECVRFNMVDPDACYATDTQYCLLPFGFEDAVTITRVRITCDADPTTELDWDLKFADAFIGLASATLIAAIDTTTGTANITSFSDATVPADKPIYIEFGADPDDNITQACVEIEFTRD